MVKAVVRWVLVLGVLLVVGPLVAMLLGGLRDVDGGSAVTLLINGEPAKALMAGAAIFGAATVVGLVGSHFLSLNTGMMMAGFVLAWGRWGEGTLEDLIQRTRTGKDMTMLAVEGGAVMLLAAALVWAMTAVAHRAQNGPSGGDGSKAGPLSILITGSDGEGAGKAVLSAFVGGLAASALVVWFVAVSSSKGQTLAAVILGGIGAGVVAQVAAGSKNMHVRPVLPMLSVLVVAVAGPLAAVAMHGQGLVAAVLAGKVLALARPISLDWVAGAMLGVPIGLGWAGSMLDRRHLQ